jgi:hypothetical protein
MLSGLLLAHSLHNVGAEGKGQRCGRLHKEGCVGHTGLDAKELLNK